MNTRTGILVIVVLAVLLVALAGCQTVPAVPETVVKTTQEELMQMLEGKKVIHQGVCPMETPEKLATSEKTYKFDAPCVAGRDPREPGKTYIGLVDEKGYTLIIVMDDKGAQTIVWRRPGTGV